ncbi:MAG: Rieske 2Fe-2S domain-containing protein, partial [Deltaproteobacteria bacterium]|nr:Rieske 2Fe-2S domain-containing protein [Deltaproteobacteria bacterium]
MLSQEENEQMTQVGPGTAMGELWRRYWHPIAASAELLERPTKAVRVLGEDLVLFRDKQGRPGLIGPQCAHRRMSMVLGIPDKEGLRCAYHGWLFGRDGKC